MAAVVSLLLSLQGCATACLWGGGYMHVDPAYLTEGTSEADTQPPLWAKVVLTPYTLAVDVLFTPFFIVPAAVGLVGRVASPDDDDV